MVNGELREPIPVSKSITYASYQQRVENILNMFAEARISISNQYDRLHNKKIYSIYRNTEIIYHLKQLCPRD